MMSKQAMNVATPRTDAFLASNAPIIAVKDFMRQLEREFADLKDRQAWRPIETAPRDGTSIILFDEGMEDQVFEGYYGSDDDGVKRWHQLGWNNKVHPTHWQPLPEPPKGSAE